MYVRGAAVCCQLRNLPGVHIRACVFSRRRRYLDSAAGRRGRGYTSHRDAGRASGGVRKA